MFTRTQFIKSGIFGLMEMKLCKRWWFRKATLAVATAIRPLL